MLVPDLQFNRKEPVAMTTGIELPTTAQAEALFVSDLTAFARHTQASVEEAIRRAISLHGGVPGCAAMVAAAYGEHPEIASARMQWARGVVEHGVRALAFAQPTGGLV
jgi:hypothetical protein